MERKFKGQVTRGELERLLCVAKPGWEDEPKKVWDCTTCKKYVKMMHLCKMWEQDRVELQIRRWEGQNECSMHVRHSILFLTFELFLYN